MRTKEQFAKGKKVLKEECYADKLTLMSVGSFR